jgi:hypothetical protein
MGRVGRAKPSRRAVPLQLRLPQLAPQSTQSRPPGLQTSRAQTLAQCSRWIRLARAKGCDGAAASR